MSSTQGVYGCASLQACAALAVDGNLANLFHTAAVPNIADYAWGMWDTGSTTTSIDRVYFLGRNEFSKAFPLWHRDQNMEVAVTNDSMFIFTGIICNHRSMQILTFSFLICCVSQPFRWLILLRLQVLQNASQIWGLKHPLVT